MAKRDRRIKSAWMFGEIYPQWGVGAVWLSSVQYWTCRGFMPPTTWVYGLGIAGFGVKLVSSVALVRTRETAPAHP